MLRRFAVVKLFCRHPMISLVSVTMADCLITILASLFVNTQQYYQVIEAVLSTDSRHQTATPEVVVDFQKTPIHDQYPLQEQICAYFQQKTPEITWRPMYPETPSNQKSHTYIRPEKITPFQFDVLVTEISSGYGLYGYHICYDLFHMQWRYGSPL